MDTSTHATRLAKADQALSDHFTDTMGAKAQRYEPSVSGGISEPEIDIMRPGRSHARARYIEIDQMLGQMPAEQRRIVRLVYAHGTDAISDALDDRGIPMAGKPSGLIEGRNRKADPLGLLRYALAPSWGHGSFLRLVVGQHRALKAFARRFPQRPPTGDAVLDFLAYEAGRGKPSEGLLANLRLECEQVRDEALGAFETVRQSHVAAAKSARDAREALEVNRAAELVQRRARAAGARRIPACLRLAPDDLAKMRELASALAQELGLLS